MYFPTANFFDTTPNDDWKENRNLVKFLNDAKSVVLLVRQIDNEIDFETEVYIFIYEFLKVYLRSLRYYFQVLDTDRRSSCLAFYKQFLNKEDKEEFSLNLVSLQGSAGVSLYHALNAVYTPLLQKVLGFSIFIQKYIQKDMSVLICVKQQIPKVWVF